METPSTRLYAKLTCAYPVVSAYAQQIWSSPRIRDLYPIYLGTMHMIVRSAVPLMEAAMTRAMLQISEDPLAASLIKYLKRHIKEEIGHDGWLLEDLKAIGADPDEFLRLIPSPHVAELVGAQYYWLHHHHPVSILGHLAAIECYHPPSGFAERLRALTGYPKEGFRAIARHEVLDVHHKQEIFSLIDRLPLKPDHEKMVGISALHTMNGEIDVLSSIYERLREQITS